MIAAGGAVASAAIGAGSAIKASNTAAAGAQAGRAANANALFQQQGITRQQMEQNRPLVQTRDAALNQLNAFFGLPTNAPSGSGQQNLIALPGIQYKASRDIKGGGLFGGPDIPGESVQAFYDQSSGNFVDAAGNLLANSPPAGGVVPGLFHGKDNQVSIGPDGSITSIGSSGQVQLAGIPKLTKAPPTQGTQAATQGNGPDFSNILNLPIFDYQRKQGEGVINRNLAAQGKFFSGQRGQALLGFNNQLVANRLQEDYINPRFQLAGFGQQGAAANQNALNNSSQNIGQAGMNSAQLYQNAADARASGYQGVAGAINTGLNNLLTLREQELRRDNPYYGPTNPLFGAGSGRPLPDYGTWSPPPFNPNAGVTMPNWTGRRP